MNTITYLVPALGVAGLLVMFFKRGWVAKQDAGDPNMQEIANAIAAGALAFLKAEWRVLIVFGIVVSILLGYSGTLVENSSALIGISFLIGAFVSAFAGYIDEYRDSFQCSDYPSRKNKSSKSFKGFIHRR
jgi:K(+)-stimulated pyrophosphate-energized sodium pump